MLAKLQLSLWELISNKPRKNNKSRQPQARQARTRQRKSRNSDQELKTLWRQIRSEWFPDRPEIDNYYVGWSNRPQKRTLASCNIEYKRVVVARELNYEQHQKWLEPLLYHEMCHAILGYVQKRNYRSWHGKEFKQLEHQHPLMAEFDLWVKSGGWMTAVRSDRGKRAAKLRYG